MNCKILHKQTQISHISLHFAVFNKVCCVVFVITQIQHWSNIMSAIYTITLHNLSC